MGDRRCSWQSRKGRGPGGAGTLRGYHSWGCCIQTAAVVMLFAVVLNFAELELFGLKSLSGMCLVLR